MKKNYFFTLLLTLCFSAISFGQGSEDFTNSNATNSYTDGNFVGNNGITWTYVASRDGNGDANGSGISLPALMLRRSSDDSKITSSTIAGGIGDFSVKLYKGFTGGGNRQVELFINGVSKGVSTPFDDFTEHTFTVSGINITGDVVIEIRNITAKQVIIDDITWTAPSTDPGITISSPTNNQEFDGTTTTKVNLNLSISNFTLSGDNGSGMSDNTGDGYIKGTLTTTDVDHAGDKNIFSGDLANLFVDVNPGFSYTATAELVDNNGNSLSPQVTASVTFTVTERCDLVLGSINTTCDALTAGNDTYSGTIAFTGGNTGVTYTITAPTGVTVGGDNPDNVAAGTITFSGMTEGTDAAVTIVGGAGSSCNFSRTLYSPTCVAFPVVDTFNYTVGQNLGDQPLWTNSNSGDEILITTATIANPFGAGQFADPTGNMVSFDGTGMESSISFNAQNSGVVYTSFIFTATDISSLTTDGYFAVLTESSGTYRSRIWLRQDQTDPTKYNVGISATSSTTTIMYDAVQHTPGEEIFVVLGYNFATNELKLWLDPDPASFETASVPTASVTVTATGSDIPSDLGQFLLRQDSSTETPPINFDELRIGTTWAQVTPKSATAGVERDNIDGFAVYPNPVNSGFITIRSSNNESKAVSIYNVIGKQVYFEQFSGTQKRLNISKIHTGIYIMKVVEGEKISTKKLVIK